jgi:hypothetical protein
MPEVEREAEEQLREVVQELRAVHYRLLGIAASLTPAERPAPEEAEGTAVRAVVECVLLDRIRPAIEDLAAAAADLREEPAEPPQ